MYTWGNQLIPEPLLKLSDTLDIQYRYNEHVHENVSCQNKYFWQSNCLLNLAILYSLCILDSSFLYWPLLCGGYLISIAYHSLYMSIFLSPLKILSQISQLLWEPNSSNLYTPWDGPGILWERKSRCWVYILPSFSISHSNVIHRKICVKDFSGTTAPRILKSGTNVGYDLLHFLRENQTHDAYHFLYLSIFLSLQSDFLLQNSWFLWELESSNFLYTLRVAKYIVGQKTKMLRSIFTIFSIFSISHSNEIHREICVKDFSGTAASGIMKFSTNVGYDLLCCVKENQHAAAYRYL